MNKSKNSKKKNNRKNIIIISLAVLLIGLLTTGSWLYLQRTKVATEVSHEEGGHDSVAATTVIEARQFIDKKDVAAGAAYYDEQISKADDGAVRKELQIAKVDYLLQAQDNAGAVAAAQVVVKTYSNDSLAYAALARAYEANGQRAEALDQYRLALEKVEPNQPASRVNPRTVYEAKIKELES
ncbi:MAG: hypothetical protein ABWX90_03550 [Candidatus Saccharimonadales bacterium]